MSANEDYHLYLDEAEEHLESFNQVILALDKTASTLDLAALNEILASSMRDLHSLKSATSVFPILARVGRTVHGVESLVLNVSKGKFPFSAVVVEIFLECIDELKTCMRQMREAESLRECKFLDTLLDKLDVLLIDDEEDQPAPVEAPAAPTPEVTSAPTAGWDASDIAEMLPDFIEEARELLDLFSQHLIELENNPGDDDLVNRVFRVAHTLKGSAGMIGLRSVETLTHRMESRMDAIRKGRDKITPELMDVLLNCQDALREMINRVATGESPEIDVSALTMRLEGKSPSSAPPSSRPEPTKPAIRNVPPPATPTPPPAMKPMAAPAAPLAAPSAWDPAEYAEMLSDFIEEARDVMESFGSSLVELEKNPADSELVDRIFRAAHTLKGSAGMMNLKSMEKLTHRMENRLDAIRKGNESVTPVLMDGLLVCLDGLKEMLASVIARQAPTVDIEPLLAQLDGQSQISAPPSTAVAPTDARVAEAGQPESEPPAAPSAEEPDAVPRLLITKKTASAAMDPGAATLRVGIDKLDKVMNLVGELAINKISFDQRLEKFLAAAGEILRRGRPARAAKTAGQGRQETSAQEGSLDDTATDLLQISDRMSALATELQESVMKTRMVPIAQVFNKFPRTIRDLARVTGKKIRLEIEGAETELDKTVVEKIGDPLMHLIRNSVDHGIELPEVRAAEGKDEEGRVVLRASQIGDHIMIEIEDDGAGIDPEKMKQSALKKGILTEEIAAGMSDREALNLIFRAGFSTAAKVTDLSGRGVGMDVVRDNVEALKGTLEIRSVVGEGSTMLIKLPLTLAIIQVLLVQSAGETFAIPISSIEENLYIPQGDLQHVGTKEVIEVRGQTLALMRLDEILELPPLPGAAGRGGTGNEKPIAAIVVRMMGVRIAIAVDRFIKKQEVVIKNLGNLLKKVRFAAGSTILGDGRAVIILDIPEIIKAASTECDRPRATATTAGDKATARARRILVVEDSNVVRRRIKEILEGANHHVSEAVDGKDGLTQAKREPFDLVTVDIMMPRMDGYELTSRLRALPEYKTTPIVMISSRAEEVDKKRGFDVGVDDYITKPFVQDRLISCIEKYLK